MKELDFEKPSFLGMVTASVSHDLQNVLAIVKETSGLMQDILLMHQDSLSPEMAEKFSISISRVQNQIERGVGITSALNGFAHTADSSEVVIDVLETIQRVVFLTRRIFQHQGMSIEISGSGDPLMMQVDPLLFQMLIFKSLQYVGGARPDAAVLKISVEGKAGIAISVSLESDNAADVSKQQERRELRRITEDLNAIIKFEDERPGILIGFLI